MALIIVSVYNLTETRISRKLHWGYQKRMVLRLVSSQSYQNILLSPPLLHQQGYSQFLQRHLFVYLGKRITSKLVEQGYSTKDPSSCDRGQSECTSTPVSADTMCVPAKRNQKRSKQPIRTKYQDKMYSVLSIVFGVSILLHSSIEWLCYITVAVYSVIE